MWKTLSLTLCFYMLVVGYLPLNPRNTREKSTLRFFVRNFLNMDVQRYVTESQEFVTCIMQSVQQKCPRYNAKGPLLRCN